MKRIISILASAALLLGALSSCQPQTPVDRSEFSLYYAGVTDISPSTNFKITPTYHGATPSDFKVYEVKCDGVKVETACFAVDPDSGELFISGTESLQVGLYTVSISCVSAGKTFSFPDAVSFNLMKPVPDSITIDPDYLEVDLGDIVMKSEKTLPTAQISVSEGAVTIQKYLVANVRKDGKVVPEAKDWFKVSATGEVSIVPENKDFVPGEYTLDFKLTTYIVGESSEEGLYENALKVNATSKPLAVKYADGQVEKGYSLVSQAPEFVGSLEDLNFAIKSKSVAGFPVSINATTGVITTDATSLEIGDECTVDLTITNKFGSTDFEAAYKVEVVAYIAPITSLSYADKNGIIQGAAFASDAPVCDGGNLTYSFVDLPTNLSALSLDGSTGVVSAAKGNKIEPGSYSVTVKAENVKGSKTATFNFQIIANPFMFTTVHWGNNLSLDNKKEASQYRWDNNTDSHTINVVSSDIPAGQPVKFAVTGGSFKPAIDAETGSMTYSRPDGAKGKVFTTIVTVTVGGDDPSAVTKRFPVFNQWPEAIEGAIVRYTPMALHVNPAVGGSSNSPTCDQSGFALGTSSLDYRRTFNYYNLNGEVGTLTDGASNTSGSILYNITTTWYGSINQAPNYASRDPYSLYSNKGSQNQKLLYTDKENLKVVVNPNVWKVGENLCDGVFTGQQTFLVGGGDPQSSKSQQFVIAIWLDSEFSNK